MKIIDVSKYQGNIDWQAAAEDGVEIAICKATGAEIGSHFTDSKFAQNFENILLTGAIRGCYHFLHGALDGRAQGEYYLDVVHKSGGFQQGDIMPIVDCEWPKEGGQHAKIENIKAFVDRMQESGLPCMIYTGGWWWNPMNGDKSFAASCKLWLAAYIQSQPSPPSPWAAVDLWQYTDRGQLKGIVGNVDMNRLISPIEALLI